MSLQKSKSHRMLRGNGAHSVQSPPKGANAASSNSTPLPSTSDHVHEASAPTSEGLSVAQAIDREVPAGMQSNAVYEEPPPLPMIYDFDPNDSVWTYEILDFTEDVRRICPRLLQDKKLLGWQIDCEDPDIPGKFRLKMERARLEKIHERMRASYDNLRMQRPSDPNLVITDGVDKTEIVTADQIAKHLQANA